MLNHAICPVVELKVGLAIVTNGSNLRVSTINSN